MTRFWVTPSVGEENVGSAIATQTTECKQMVTAYRHRLNTGHVVYLENRGDHVMLRLSNRDRSQWSTQQFSISSRVGEPRLYPTAQGAIITLSNSAQTYYIQCQQGQMQIATQVSEKVAADVEHLTPQAMEQTEPIAETASESMSMSPMKMPPMKMPPMSMPPMNMGSTDTASVHTVHSSTNSSTNSSSVDSDSESINSGAMNMRMGNMSMSMKPFASSTRSSETSAPKPQKRFCTQCGSPIEPEDKFCGQCGTALS